MSPSCGAALVGRTLAAAEKLRVAPGATLPTGELQKLQLRAVVDQLETVARAAHIPEEARAASLSKCYEQSHRQF